MYGRCTVPLQSLRSNYTDVFIGLCQELWYFSETPHAKPILPPHCLASALDDQLYLEQVQLQELKCLWLKTPTQKLGRLLGTCCFSRTGYSSSHCYFIHQLPVCISPAQKRFTDHHVLTVLYICSNLLNFGYHHCFYLLSLSFSTDRMRFFFVHCSFPGAYRMPDTEQRHLINVID